MMMIPDSARHDCGDAFTTYSLPGVAAKISLAYVWMNLCVEGDVSGIYLVFTDQFFAKIRVFL